MPDELALAEILGGEQAGKPDQARQFRSPGPVRRQLVLEFRHGDVLILRNQSVIHSDQMHRIVALGQIGADHLSELGGLGGQGFVRNHDKSLLPQFPPDPGMLLLKIGGDLGQVNLAPILRRGGRVAGNFLPRFVPDHIAQLVSQIVNAFLVTAPLGLTQGIIKFAIPSRYRIALEEFKGGSLSHQIMEQRRKMIGQDR